MSFYDFNAMYIISLGIHPKLVGDRKFWEVANQTGFWEAMPLCSRRSGILGRNQASFSHCHNYGPKGGNLLLLPMPRRLHGSVISNHGDVIVCLSKHATSYEESRRHFD